MKKLIGLLFSLTAMAQTDSVSFEKYIEGRNPESVNYIRNSSCFKGVTNITATNTTASKNTTTPLTSISDCQATLDSATDTLEWSANTLDRSLKGGNCEVGIRYKLTLGSGNTIQLQARINSATVASTNLVTSDNGTAVVNFPCGDLSNAPSLRIAQTAGSSSQAINVANVYLGAARNIGTVAQASLVGQAYYATTTNCTWSVTNASFTDFGTDADCPAPTIEQNSGPGTISTTDADLPQVTVSNLPPGNYQVVASFHSGYTATSGEIIGYRISDGTTGGGNVTHLVSAALDETIQETVIMTFAYSSAGSRTFKLQGFSSSNSVTIPNNGSNRRLTFTITRFPSSSEIAVRPDQANYGWTAYTPSLSAGFGTPTNVSFLHRRVGENLEVIGSLTTGTVSASTANIGLPSGLEIDSAKLSITNNTTAAAGTRVGISTQQGSTNGGTIVTAPGTSLTNVYLGGLFTTGTTMNTAQNVANVHSSSNQGSYFFSVPIKGWTANQNAPLLVGSVTSGYLGAARIEWASVTSQCTTSPCTIASQSGAFTSITRASNGDYTANFPAGTWSVAPVCIPFAGNTSGRIAQRAGSVTTTTAWNFFTVDATFSLADSAFFIQCVGPR
jgi:hypothetical protein